MTDIQTTPAGNLDVVSLTEGAVFEIYRKLAGQPHAQIAGAGRLLSAPLIAGREGAGNAFRVAFGLERPANVRLTVHDVAGRTIATLTSGRAEAGSHSIRWSAGGVARGVYLVRLEADAGEGSRETSAAKMVVLD